MGRSKKLGKEVQYLSKDELQLEKSRCENAIRVYKTGPAVKGLRKRLNEIENRIRREAEE